MTLEKNKNKNKNKKGSPFKSNRIPTRLRYYFWREAKQPITAGVYNIFKQKHHFLKAQ